MIEAPEFSVFDEYVEPKQAEKDALIDRLLSGDFTLSYSSLSAFAISPRSFIAYKLQEKKTTKGVLLGEVSHCLVWEPNEFKSRFIVAPDVDATTVAGKKAWAGLYTRLTGDELPVNSKGNPELPKLDTLIAAVKEYTKKVDQETGKTLHPGMTIIPATLHKDAEFRARMLVNNRATRHIIDMVGETEVFCQYEISGVKFTGKIDGKGQGMIVDMKNMPDAALRPAKYTIHARKLNWQAFGYNLATGENNTCYILAVDGNGETSAHQFDERHLQNAKVEMEEYVDLFMSLVTDSLFDRSVWDQSQDFWLKNSHNPYGINKLF